MRVSVLLLALCLAVVPAAARGSRGGGHSRSSSGSHYRSSRSYSSHSYRSRSSGSSYRNHSYRSRSPHTTHRSYASSSHRSHPSSTYSGVRRDSHGRIKRSAEAKDAFKRQHPCPSTGKRSGACPGYVIDHIRPLANGGADDPSNMQWQTKADAKAKDKWERKH